jgi:hypothetical protein
MAMARASQRLVLGAGSLFDDLKTPEGIPFLGEVTLADLVEFPGVQDPTVWMMQPVMGSMARTIGPPTGWAAETR